MHVAFVPRGRGNESAAISYADRGDGDIVAESAFVQARAYVHTKDARLHKFFWSRNSGPMQLQYRLAPYCM